MAKRKWCVEELFAMGAFDDDDDIFSEDHILGDISDRDDDDGEDILEPGEFNDEKTATENDSREPVTSSVKSASSSAADLYECQDCSKSYKSVSGFRGHMRKVHRKQSVKGMSH